MTGKKLKSKVVILGIALLILVVACTSITTPTLWVPFWITATAHGTYTVRK